MIKGQKKKPKQTRGTIYYFDKIPCPTIYASHTFYIPINMPPFCSCWMKETSETKRISAIVAQSIGSRRYIKKMMIKLPFCKECRSLHKKPGAKITALTMDFNECGLMFTNKNYADAFSKANNMTYSDFEDTGRISAMFDSKILNYFKYLFM